MKYQVENMPLLKNILWVDTFLGGGTALIGLNYVHNATFFGAVFLVLQVVVAGMLAWLEGRHIRPLNGGSDGSTTLPPMDQ
jgi:hypothetical protein